MARLLGETSQHSTNSQRLENLAGLLVMQHERPFAAPVLHHERVEFLGRGHEVVVREEGPAVPVSGVETPSPVSPAEML